MNKANYNYLHGKLSDWFYSLKAIKLIIISRIGKEEREQLINKEKEIEKYKDYLAIPKARTILINLIEDYDIRIKELLEAKGFLVPLKEDNTNLFNSSGDE